MYKHNIWMHISHTNKTQYNIISPTRSGCVQTMILIIVKLITNVFTRFYIIRVVGHLL